MVLLGGIGIIDILIIIGERREPHTYRTAEKNLRHIYIYNWRAERAHTYRTAAKNLRHNYIYMFFIYIYIYIYIRSYVVHVPFTRALRANVGPAG